MQASPAPLVTVEQLKDGGKIVIEWLGDGGQPVPEEQSERRSVVCRKCPMNARGVTVLARTVAGAIRRHLAWKHKMKLPHDASLGTCTACRCVLNLKVWVPLKHIFDTLPQEKLDRLHPDCWVRSELHAEMANTA